MIPYLILFAVVLILIVKECAISLAEKVRIIPWNLHCKTCGKLKPDDRIEFYTYCHKCEQEYYRSLPRKSDADRIIEAINNLPGTSYYEGWRDNP